MKFKEGDLVKIKGVEGAPKYGVIRGKATIEVYGVGHTWIVENLESELISETYPYSCFAVPEAMLTLVMRGKEREI